MSVLARSRADRLASQFAGRTFHSLAELRNAAGARGWTQAALSSALEALAEQGAVSEDRFGRLVIGRDAAQLVLERERGPR